MSLKKLFLFLFFLFQSDVIASEQKSFTKDACFNEQINSAKVNNQDYTDLLKRIINRYEGTKEMEYPMFSKHFAAKAYYDLAELTLQKAIERGLVGYNKFNLFDEAEKYVNQASKMGYDKHLIIKFIIQKTKQISNDEILYKLFLECEKAYNEKHYQKALVCFTNFVSKVNRVKDLLSNSKNHYMQVLERSKKGIDNALENLDLLRIKSHQYIGLIYSEDHSEGIKEDLDIAIENLEKAAKYAQEKSGNTSDNFQIEFYGNIFQQIEVLLCNITAKNNKTSTVCVVQ